MLKTLFLLVLGASYVRAQFYGYDEQTEPEDYQNYPSNNNNNNNNNNNQFADTEIRKKKKGPPKPYAFSYGVQGDKRGGSFGQQEHSDGKIVKGTYVVNLPDGRKQVVEYTAGDRGFEADVSYQGKARYPKQKKKQEQNEWNRENELIRLNRAYSHYDEDELEDEPSESDYLGQQQFTYPYKIDPNDDKLQKRQGRLQSWNAPIKRGYSHHEFHKTGHYNNDKKPKKQFSHQFPNMPLKQGGHNAYQTFPKPYKKRPKPYKKQNQNYKQASLPNPIYKPQQHHFLYNYPFNHATQQDKLHQNPIQEESNINEEEEEDLEEDYQFPEFNFEDDNKDKKYAASRNNPNKNPYYEEYFEAPEEPQKPKAKQSKNKKAKNDFEDYFNIENEDEDADYLESRQRRFRPQKKYLIGNSDEQEYPEADPTNNRYDKTQIEPEEELPESSNYRYPKKSSDYYYQDPEATVNMYDREDGYPEATYSLRRKPRERKDNSDEEYYQESRKMESNLPGVKYFRPSSPDITINPSPLISMSSNADSYLTDASNQHVTVVDKDDFSDYNIDSKTMESKNNAKDSNDEFDDSDYLETRQKEENEDDVVKGLYPNNEDYGDYYAAESNPEGQREKGDDQYADYDYVEDAVEPFFPGLKNDDEEYKEDNERDGTNQLDRAGSSRNDDYSEAAQDPDYNFSFKDKIEDYKDYGKI